MAARTFRLRGDHRELYVLFKTLLREVNFVTIHEEQFGEGFRVVAANNKRMSQRTSTLLSLIGGYLPRKRVAVELLASQKNGDITAELRCVPYIDILDMEAAVESQEERDRCGRLVDLFGDRILEDQQPDDQGP